MPKELGQNFSKSISIPIQIIPSTGSLDGAAVDTYLADGSAFDTALALIEIGNITGTPTSVKVKIEEDDDAAFGGASVADGGAEITVAQDHSYTMEIKRTKRYLRIVVTTDGGTTPTVECFGVFLLWSAAKPFPRLSADDIDNS